MKLKSEFGGNLQRPGPAATQDRIADAHVGRHSDRQSANGAPIRADSVSISNRLEVRQIRTGKVRMIQQVVSLKAQFQLEALRDVGVLEDGEIELTEGRPD